MKFGIFAFIALLPEIILTGITVMFIDSGIVRKKRLLGIIPSLLVGAAILGWGSFLIYEGIVHDDLPWWMLLYAAINIIWGLIVLIGGTAYAAFSQFTLTTPDASMPALSKEDQDEEEAYQKFKKEKLYKKYKEYEPEITETERIKADKFHDWIDEMNEVDRKRIGDILGDASPPD